jgi:hypothetical protein
VHQFIESVVVCNTFIVESIDISVTAWKRS